MFAVFVCFVCCVVFYLQFLYIVLTPLIYANKLRKGVQMVPSFQELCYIIFNNLFLLFVYLQQLRLSSRSEWAERRGSCGGGSSGPAERQPPTAIPATPLGRPVYPSAAFPGPERWVWPIDQWQSQSESLQSNQIRRSVRRYIKIKSAGLTKCRSTTWI